MPQRQADPLKIAAPEVRGPGPIRAGLVVVYLVGLYTYVPLTVLPGPAIPAFVAGGAGFLLLLLNLPRLRPRATWRSGDSRSPRRRPGTSATGLSPGSTSSIP
jgi:hypothetical protein